MIETEPKVACPSCSGEGCSEYSRIVDPDGRCDGGGEVTPLRRQQIINWHASDFYHKKLSGYYDDDDDDWDPRS